MSKLNYEAGKLRRPITDEVKRMVLEDLPELASISEDALRQQCIDAWALALCGSSFERVRDIPGDGYPGCFRLKRGIQCHHLRGMARIAVSLADEFKSSFPEIDIDRDIVLAGALIHDIGKPWEFDPANQDRWTTDPARTGEPSVRHSVYGVHICLTAGLPEELVHVAVGHSSEGVHIGLSLECLFIRTADHSWWTLAAASGLIEPASKLAPWPLFDSMVRPRKLLTE